MLTFERCTCIDITGPMVSLPLYMSLPWVWNRFNRVLVFDSTFFLPGPDLSSQLWITDSIPLFSSNLRSILSC